MVQLDDDVMDSRILSDLDQKLLEQMRLLRRPLSIPEMRMIRHCYEIERCREENGGYLMAAATDGLNEAMLRESAESREAVFRSADGLCHMHVRIPHGKDLPVYLRMTDEAGEPVAGGRIVFPGNGKIYEMNARGRCSMAYADYLDCINSALTVQCAGASGEVMDLVLEGNV